MTPPRWQVDNLGITQEYIKNALHYCPETGIFTWKHREDRTKSWNSRYSGKCAGTVSNYGSFIQIFIKRRPYKAHRLAWLYTYGAWPTDLIDHIDGNCLNNAISNLRQATYRENACNRKRRSNNTSGFKGVSWRKSQRKWAAEIVSDGKRKFLGLFPSAEQAYSAYCEAATRLHGEFARFT